MAAANKRSNKNYILYSIILAIITIVTYFIFQTKGLQYNAKQQKYNLAYPKELVKLADKLGMEPIEGEKFLENLKVYGGQGLPYAFNVLTSPLLGSKRVPANVIFWCQKGKKKYLVYAEDNQKEEKYWNYEVKSIISEAEIVGHNYDIEGSYGIVVYDGILGITQDLSHFAYLDNPSEHGPKDVYPIYSNGFLPIIIYQESSTIVIYRYKERWLKYSEVDV